VGSLKTFALRSAKSSLSAIVDAAERGEATTITKHGKPAAMIVPIRDGQRMYAVARPSFADLLMAIPSSLDLDRDPSPLCPADL